MLKQRNFNVQIYIPSVDQTRREGYIFNTYQLNPMALTTWPAIDGPENMSKRQHKSVRQLIRNIKGDKTAKMFYFFQKKSSKQTNRGSQKFFSLPRGNPPSPWAGNLYKIVNTSGLHFTLLGTYCQSTGVVPKKLHDHGFQLTR